MKVSEATLVSLDDVAARLREARRAAGLTQRELAERIGVPRRRVWSWENAERLPTTQLPKLAHALDVSASWLLHGVEPASVELHELRVDVAKLATSLADLDERITALALSTEETFAVVRDALTELLARDGGEPERL